MKTSLVADALRAALPPGRRKATGDAVFNALAQRVAGLASSADRWDLFVQVLTAAESEDLLVLPSKSGDGWNDAVEPARPKWVSLPPEQVVRDRFDHRAFPWNPRLSFLADKRALPVGIKDAALAIQQFFTAGGDARPPAPIKERSYDIFRDEKRLEGLQHSQILFGEGQVTLDLLRCYVVSPTPITERLPHGRGIIVLENEATFDSFCRLARVVPTWRLIVYGRGNEIQKCVGYLAREIASAGGEPVDYFGDIDRRGLDIPQQLVAKGIPAAPFLPGYEFLLRNVAVSDGPPQKSRWLPSGLAARAAAIVESGGRIPQEAFGWEELAQMHGLDPFLS